MTVSIHISYVDMHIMLNRLFSMSTSTMNSFYTHHIYDLHKSNTYPTNLVRFRCTPILVMNSLCLELWASISK